MKMASGTVVTKVRERLEEYLESLIDVAAQGNANTAAFHAKDIERIFQGKLPKQTIYIITENDRYGEETWDLGTPDNITIEWDRFDFDTKNGDPTIEEVKLQIERLKELEKLSGHDLSSMVTERMNWIEEQENYERIVREQQVAADAARLEAAREVLRKAGELPEVPDGNTPNNQA